MSEQKRIVIKDYELLKNAMNFRSILLIPQIKAWLEYVDDAKLPLYNSSHQCDHAYGTEYYNGNVIGHLTKFRLEDGDKLTCEVHISPENSSIADAINNGELIICSTAHHTTHTVKLSNGECEDKEVLLYVEGFFLAPVSTKGVICYGTYEGFDELMANGTIPRLEVEHMPTVSYLLGLEKSSLYTEITISENDDISTQVEKLAKLINKYAVPRANDGNLLLPYLKDIYKDYFDKDLEEMLGKALYEECETRFTKLINVEHRC